MAKFFEALISKFFDFFNFGRFITIVIPGFVAALCFAMLMSQLIFQEKHQKKEIQKKEASCCCEVKMHDAGKKDINQQASDDDLFIKQIKNDYNRVKGNFLLMTILAIMLGLMIYEVGYCILRHYRKRPREGTKDDTKLFRYSSEHDAADSFANKFNPSKEEVSLIYFAPFLKEKFSGDENYFDFLITEFYRFLEFSINISVSIFMSLFIGVFYYVLFCFRNFCWPCRTEFIFFFLILSLLTVVFFWLVFLTILKAYNKASHDLVLGVSDFMAKNLWNKGGT